MSKPYETGLWAVEATAGDEVVLRVEDSRSKAEVAADKLRADGYRVKKVWSLGH